MRGRKSGHRCALPLPVAPGAAAQEGLRVLADFDENYPVSPAELDAIESFLGPLIKTLLEGELTAADSERTQIPATVEQRTAREARYGIFVEDPI